MNKLGAWATERMSCAASLRLAATTESSRHKQLASLRAQEMEASTRLGELLSCLDALQQELMDATSRRGQLLAEQAAVEDRMRAAQTRMPEVEGEKKTAAAKKVGWWKQFSRALKSCSSFRPMSASSHTYHVLKA
jgi:chromosome segregation ATPase